MRIIEIETSLQWPLPDQSQWYPVFTQVVDGDRLVLQVAGWQGGAGDQPEIGAYVGENGFVDNIADAVDVSEDLLPVVASAGPEQILTHTTTQAELAGAAIPGSGAVVSTLWSLLSAPAGVAPVIKSPSSLTSQVTGLGIGNSVFQLTATDSNGFVSTSQVTISVMTAQRLYDMGVWKVDGVNEMHALGYIPEGDDLTVAKPVLFYFHGAAENGSSTGVNNNPWALTWSESSGLPYMISRGMKWEVRTIFAQRRTGFWTSDVQVDEVVDWGQTKFSVDINQVHLYGPSSGGGGVLNAGVRRPNFYASISAAAPVAVASVVANPAAFSNTFVQLLHGLQDATIGADDPGSTWAIVNAMNGLATPNRYSPVITIVPDEIHSASLWRDYWEDKARAFLRLDEVIRMRDLRPVETARRHVEKAEESGDFRDFSVAQDMVAKLPASEDKDALAAVLAAIPLTGMYFLNLGSTDNAFTNFTINNAPSPANGTTVSNIKDIRNNSSSLGFQVVSNGGAAYTAGMTASLFGLSPLMVSTGFPITTTASTYKITGIPAGKQLDIYVYYSDRNTNKLTANGFTGFTIKANGDAYGNTRLAPWNSRFTVDLLNVNEVAGEVTLVVQAYNAQGGTIIGIAFQVRDVIAPIFKAQFDFRTTAATSPGWTSFIGRPATAVASAFDNSVGVTVDTVSSGVPYWRSVADGAVANSDVEGPDVGTYPNWMTQTVGRSSLFNFATSWKRDSQNYNVKFIPFSGKWPSGLYRMRVFACAEKNIHVNNAQYIGKIGSAGQNKQMLAAYNVDMSVSTGRWLEFIGRITDEDQDLKLAFYINSASAGVAYLNAITIEMISL